MSRSRIWTPKTIRDLARKKLEAESRQTHKEQKSHLQTSQEDGTNSKKFEWGRYQSSEGNKVFLVTISSGEAEVDESNQEEMLALIQTLGLRCVGEKIFKLPRGPQAATFIGLGQAEKIKLELQTREAVALVIDAPLSPGQVKNLEKILEAPVVDREGLIISIFEDHASSSLSKIQVELAKLRYLQPRLSGIWSGLSRQRGGSGGLKGRGQGETRLELDRRVIKNRIAQLLTKLSAAERVQEQQSRGRGQEFFQIALVGYTNAGKSYLMNRLTKAGVESSDKLFATLDTRIRRLKAADCEHILVSDTVGFVRKLPPGLVASFKSTLRHACESDLLLHVLDASVPTEQILERFNLTEDILQEIEAARTREVAEPAKRLLVLNKIDLLGSKATATVAALKKLLQIENQKRSHKVEILDICGVSCADKIGLENLIKKIRDYSLFSKLSQNPDSAREKGNPLSNDKASHIQRVSVAASSAELGRSYE